MKKKTFDKFGSQAHIRAKWTNPKVLKARRLQLHDFENAPSREGMSSFRYGKSFFATSHLNSWMLDGVHKDWDSLYSKLCEHFPRRTRKRALLESYLKFCLTTKPAEDIYYQDVRLGKLCVVDGVLYSCEEQLRLEKERHDPPNVMVYIDGRPYGSPSWSQGRNRRIWYELDLIVLNQDSEWDMYWQKDYLLGHYYDAEKALAFYGDANLCCNKLYQVYDRRILRKIAEVSDRY